MEKDLRELITDSNSHFETCALHIVNSLVIPVNNTSRDMERHMYYIDKKRKN
jgi:hypothetical protein